MKYTVVWTLKAEQNLAAIWTNAADREIIASAANSIDQQLANNPIAVGESRPDGRRIAHYLPLGIRFRIHEDDRLVRVLTVWLCHPIAR